jgi:arsenite methyltransferase
MVAILGFTRDDILVAVKDMYTAVATAPTARFHFPVGLTGCRAVGYPEEALRGLPDAAVESFAGVGYPFRAGVIRSGDTVLDIGSGAGTDALIASRLVGPSAKVYALDMTPAMVTKLRSLVAATRVANIEVIEGNAERIPLPDASVDVVTSNGMLNLVPDKRRAIAEMFRVLRPGGRVQIADIVIGVPVTPDCKADPKLWAECVVGATIDEDYLAMFRDAGFRDVEVLREFDYFAHSASQDTQDIARRFRARSIEITMRRGAASPATIVQLARRLDPRRIAAAIERRGLAGVVAFGLAACACYGTLAALAVLSLLGITLAVNDAAVAGVVALLAMLAAAVVGLGIRKHGSTLPVVPAAVGAALITYALLVTRDWRIELVGFALLAAAVVWDWRLRRHANVAPARARKDIDRTMSSAGSASD